jgi:hypothetical protein
MEEIKNKAFDDEFNKAEESIENVKRDTTPLPPHNKNTDKKKKKERN